MDDSIDSPFLLAKAIRIPKLKRRRKVWAFLPRDYFDRPDRHYPVIYFNDGQNIFENWKAAYGVSWEVHTSMRQLSAEFSLPECILIGIEHGKKYRVNEYLPLNKLGNLSASGNEYSDFLANELKAFVDNKLRTMPEREHTALVGSSMGGLNAFYTGLKHQDVFSKIGVFSPSLWATPQIYRMVKEIGQHFPMEFYLSVGTQEGKYTVKNVKTLYKTIKDAKFKRVDMNIVKGGEHNEALWHDEFRNFYLWVM